VLIPLTLGVGSILLWFWRRSFVYRVNEAGVTLWSGRLVPWSSVRSFHFRKKQGYASPEVTRVDIQFEIGRGVIAADWLRNGEELVQAFRDGVRRGMPPDGRMRANYTQRRR